LNDFQLFNISNDDISFTLDKNTMDFEVPHKISSPTVYILVPSFVRERYPNYREFIKVFLEFLENDPDGIDFKITQFLVDLKQIDYIKTVTDPTLQSDLLDAL